METEEILQKQLEQLNAEKQRWEKKLSEAKKWLEKLAIKGELRRIDRSRGKIIKKLTKLENKADKYEYKADVKDNKYERDMFAIQHGINPWESKGTAVGNVIGATGTATGQILGAIGGMKVDFANAAIGKDKGEFARSGSSEQNNTLIYVLGAALFFLMLTQRRR